MGEIIDVCHLLIVLGFFRMELKSLTIIPGSASSRHDIISLEMLSMPGDLPCRRMYAPKSISSLVISESRGPVSAVFWGGGGGGNEWFPMCGLCNTFLKCAFQLSPVIPSIKVRSFFLCSSFPNNFQNSFIFLLLHFIFWSIVSLCANLFFLTVFFREVFCLDKHIFSSSLLGSLLIFFPQSCDLHFQI